MTDPKPELHKKQPGFWLPDQSLSVILFLVFLSGVFSIIYTDSSNASQEQQRRLAYGSWHIAAYGTDEATCRHFKNHATVQTAGCMEIYGSVTEVNGRTGTVPGHIGYADQNALSLGNITLLDGRFPDTEDEIAIEAACLRRLDLPDTLGQQLTLTVSREDARTDTRTYQLCGIVQNYSANWKTDGYPLPSFFVCKNTPDAAEPGLLHVFVQMKPEFAANATSLSSLCSWHSYFVQNDFTYLQYGKETSPASVFSVWQTILLLSGALFTLALTQADIRQRYRSFLILRTLGASGKQIFSFFLREKTRMIGRSSVLGILCGILLSCLISLPLGLPVATEIYSVRIWHLLQMILSLYAGVILASAASLIPLLHLPLQKTAARPIKTRSRHRTKKRSHTIASLFRQADRKHRFLQAALTFAVAVFIYIPAYRAVHAGIAYLQYQNDYPEDYTFGNLSSYTPPHSVITAKELQQIRQTYGVKDIAAVSVSGICRIEFRNSYDTGYADKVRSFLSKQNDIAEDTGVWGMLVGCGDELLRIYTREADVNALDKTPGLDEVLLYLPDYNCSADGSLEEWKTARGMPFLSEDTITVGDVICVNTDSGKKELAVAGIIRSFSDSLPTSYHLMRPYSIICSQDTYQNTWGNTDYAFVQVFQDDTAIPYQTAAILSHQENGLYFHNKRIERIRLLRELISQTMLALLLCSSVFLAAMSVRLGIYSFYGKQIYERYRILHRLGMPQKEIQKMLLWKTFFNSLAGCGAAACVFWKVCCAEGIDLWAIVLILGGFGLNWMILFAYDYRYVKKGDS